MRALLVYEGGFRREPKIISTDILSYTRTHMVLLAQVDTVARAPVPSYMHQYLARHEKDNICQ
jgi:hypothetical protein